MDSGQQSVARAERLLIVKSINGVSSDINLSPPSPHVDGPRAVRRVAARFGSLGTAYYWAPRPAFCGTHGPC